MRRIFLLTCALNACHDRGPSTKVAGNVRVERLEDLPAFADTSSPVYGLLDEAEAIPLTDSTFALLDYAGSRVLLVDRLGRVLRAIGRHGGGPGEFQNPRFLVRLPDGFAVYDDLRLALVSFTATGAPAPEQGLADITGPLQGILTGLARLPGGWAFAVTEPPPLGPREALYSRIDGVTRLLAATPPAPGRPVRLPCGIGLSPQPPVFWPTLRWSATRATVAYAATAEDRLVVWAGMGRDSSVILGPVSPRPGTARAARDLPLAVRVSTGRKGCSIDAAGVIRQRGVAPRIPVIQRILVTPGAHIWLELATGAMNHPFRVLRPGGRVDSLSLPIVPRLFLSDTTFLGQPWDSTAEPTVSRWRVRFAD